MRRYKSGDSGDPVRDIQDRLASAGFDVESDPRGEFRDGTTAAVVAFQRSHGLDPHGEVDDSTWRTLVEAGYRLGDRVLYHRRPMLRGGDVIHLQQLLGDLGFGSDKPDGIFGPRTARAVLEFQMNRGLGEDGIAGPRVIDELRSVQRAARKVGKEVIKEREWMRRLPPTIVASRVCFDAACRTAQESEQAWRAATRAATGFSALGGHAFLSRSAAVPSDEDVRARRANQLGSDLVIGFQHPGADEAGVFFFDSGRSSSPAGRTLANFITVTTGFEAKGRALAMLRGTRAPAVVVTAPQLTDALADAVVRAVVEFFRVTASEMRS